MLQLTELSSRGPAPKYRVLVVDDDPAIRSLLRDVLSPFARVVEADRPSLALSQIARQVPDAMVIDVCLPEYSGLQLLTQLRKNLGPQLPVVMVTANAYRISAQEAQDLGAVNYFAKPFNPNHISEAVQNAIWAAAKPRAVENEPGWRKRLTGKLPQT